ncbi:hypothetical protein DGMP_19410 [Desulfomarina profundi]|uniref:VCBS repeat-containing protein n=1 Tax=Desulfomarina profundi TaxID=2772557 RepID=A0A8D5JDL1_9BACT|nr:FG-GAP repeat protein [Desulfomarina profundi]BCL61248.1 hypothetical protein DGMP_19410 [Desulfomarina profundi]
MKKTINGLCFSFLGPDEFFATAFAAGDFDNDGYDDLAIGEDGAVCAE